MIVAYNAYRMAEILERLKAPHEDYSAESDFLLDQARRVVESIVHVKQHSLADIAPAFLLLDSLGFRPRRGSVPEFLEGLFPHLPEDRAATVRAFLKAAHDRLEQERAKGKPLIAVLVSFLDEYEREMEFLLAAATASSASAPTLESGRLPAAGASRDAADAGEPAGLAASAVS
jgi:hypothetical protein